jgi:hypothetical protein
VKKEPLFHVSNPSSVETKGIRDMEAGAKSRALSHFFAPYLQKETVE